MFGALVEVYVRQKGCDCIGDARASANVFFVGFGSGTPARFAKFSMPARLIIIRSNGLGSFILLIASRSLFSRSGSEGSPARFAK